MNFGIGAIIGAIAGYFFTKGNFIGIIIGGFLGGFFDSAINGQNKTSSRTNTINKTDFGRYLMMLSSLVIKADGKTMKSELDFVKQYFTKQFGIAETQIHVQNLKKYLETNISLLKVVQEINRNLNSATKLHMLHYLIGVAHADGEISNYELNVVKNIAREMGIPSQTFDSIIAMYYYQSGGNYQNNYNNGSITNIDNSYKILGISSSADETEIKKAYRKLAVQYHPDKVSQLGEEYQKGAKEKFQKVQEAYENIKQYKGIK